MNLQNNISFENEETLITELIFNYISDSFNSTRNGKSGTIDKITLGKILKEDYLKNSFNVYLNDNKLGSDTEVINLAPDSHKVRNIIILGTGASFNLFKGIPLGSHAIDALYNQVLGIKYTNDEINTRIEKLENGKDQSLRTNLFVQILKSIRAKTKRQKRKNGQILSFEEHFSVFSEILGEEQARNILKNLVNFKYLPTLFYDTIAHLLKHRFIDAIVNFNFDELLDQSIEEELSISEYRKVISDGDCINFDDLLIEDKLKTPLYIKPHGTISHENSMRFTKDHYVNIPEGIENLLFNLFRGKNSKTTTVNKINIICIGFAMESIELNDILNDVLSPEKVQLFYLNVNEFKSNSISAFKEGINVKNIFIDPSSGNYNFFIEKFFDNLSGKFKSVPFGIRSITRHKIINTLFYRQNLSSAYSEIKSFEENHIALQHIYNNYYNSEHYFKDRLIIEIAISLLNSRGFIEPSQFHTEPAGLYYNLYKSIDPLKKKTSIYTILESIFGLEQSFSFSNNLYNVPPEIFCNSDSEEQRNSLLEYCIDKILIQNEEGLSRRVFENIKEKDSNNDAKLFLKSLFYTLTTKFIFELSPVFNDHKKTIFRSFNKDMVLHTNLAFAKEITEMFYKESGWDTLLIVTDNARLFKAIILEDSDFVDIDLLRSKKIRIILRSENAQLFGSDDENNKLIENFMDKKLKYLPYWDQKHHFVMFINTSDSSNYFKTIYYEKAGYSRRINPIRLGDDIEDQKMLLECFIQYWLKANDTPENESFDFPNIKNKEDLLKKWEEEASRDSVLYTVFQIYNKKN